MPANPEKVLLVKYSEHRWTTLLESAERILILWKALKEYALAYKVNNLVELLSETIYAKLKILEFSIEPIS